ncbi:helix-turn-helix domain-containing protein [Streptomyces syringium]|uniref:Transcriptional regulator with XRE-family HTH domain n=1 Tax=Streptomyces syringium TaxID=76729 RepID=A0ABS4Y879_9ACTN|nr:hypothetical protein [Streptomyces syringium]MBP2404622.1 transcriptional regulator with XRE-family HTH domain [Streptomyces syringium]
MASVHHWTGREASALRTALRMSMRGFAEQLGIALRTVAKWEKLGSATHPRPDTQAILDTALARATPQAQERFEALLSRPDRRTEARTPDHETWAEDIDRALVCLSHQNFTFAQDLLNRWLSRHDPTGIDDRSRYLYARSLALFGDLQRDRGTVVGPLSAHHSYNKARRLFNELGFSRRVAQVDLSLAVITEMSGQLGNSARQYEGLAADPRLSLRDRARARLWVGTALSKEGNSHYATRVITIAAQEFEDLGEPEDWSVAHQKLALAHLGTGDITRALHCIDIARQSSTADTPMQRVRLDTAHGHILLSDRGTQDDGMSVLKQAARTADHYGLNHQLRSIERIRRTYGGPPATRSTRGGRRG